MFKSLQIENFSIFANLDCQERGQINSRIGKNQANFPRPALRAFPKILFDLAPSALKIHSINPSYVVFKRLKI